MKLRKLLFYSLLMLTLIPIGIMSILLYNSGYQLSETSYLRNLSESINVQADYISQSLKNDLVSDSRFANRILHLAKSNATSPELLQQFRNYLEIAEDKVHVCALLDEEGAVLYSTGETGAWDFIAPQLPTMPDLPAQAVVEFKLNYDEGYSLGIVTPVRDNTGVYMGSMITVYEKLYIFKIISSYYEITDTATYICRANGEVIDFLNLPDRQRNLAVESALEEMDFAESGTIDLYAQQQRVMGYYQKLYTSPWVLVGMLDKALISAFLNDFLGIYLVIIAAIFLVDIVLAAYFSRKVVSPINSLILVMDGYPQSLNDPDLTQQKREYFETRYLREKFFKLMQTIQRVQYNFEGVYQLYQSNTMDDTNIEIDTIAQHAHSNKEAFEMLMTSLQLPDSACVVERFTRCFEEKDQKMLMQMFESMRDQHLSVRREADVFTPHFGKKWYHVLVVPTYSDARLSKLFIQLRDVSSFKRQELESAELAMRDQLTGLYNRGGFSSQVNAVLQQSGGTHGLLFLDVNDFKLVNDNFGHSTGDDLLCGIARALESVAGANDIVSRFGGDEFAIFMPDTTTEQVNRLKYTLSNKLMFPYHTDNGGSFVITASIGVAIHLTDQPYTLEELLQQADSAMYAEKRSFKHS